MLIMVTLFGFSETDKWFLYEDEKFRYKIEFPKEPSVLSKMVDSDIGNLKMNIAMYDASQKGQDDNMIYMTNVTEYPDSLVNSEKTELLDGFFRGAIDGAVANVNGKLLTEEIRNLSEFPGREITVDYAEGIAIIRMRLFLVHNWTYMIQTITLADKKDNKSILRFMDSFELIK